MANVKNNHNAPLFVAGVTVRPGATVQVDDERFEAWANGGTAKRWLKQEIITSDSTEVNTNGRVNRQNRKEGAERDKLLARASDLGIDDADEMDNDRLRQSIAREESNTPDRKELFRQARELGLNPNANIGTEKLQAQVAEARAAQGGTADTGTPA